MELFIVCCRWRNPIFVMNEVKRRPVGMKWFTSINFGWLAEFFTVIKTRLFCLRMQKIWLEEAKKVLWQTTKMHWNYHFFNIQFQKSTFSSFCIDFLNFKLECEPIFMLISAFLLCSPCFASNVLKPMFSSLVISTIININLKSMTFNCLLRSIIA